MTWPLAPLLEPSGLLIGLAFDHRDSLDVTLREQALGGMKPEQVRALKEAIVRVVAPEASAVMLDHDYGATALSGGSIPAGVGLIMPLEAQGYAQLGDERRATLMTDFGPVEAHGLGADACKLLVSMRPDRPSFTARQLTIVDQAVALSHRVGLPIVLEPFVYRLTAEPPRTFAERSPDLIIAATELLAQHGADLLKLPFPAVVDARRTAGSDEDGAACRALHAATSGVPWVLYGAGASAAAFESQLRVAGACGASGFLVGRTVWRDALAPDPTDVEAAARTSALPRFTRMAAIARETCRPPLVVQKGVVSQTVV